MGTIIQSYGPIYGEVVNGTVQGRPNGSVYVPTSNTVRLLNYTSYITNATVGGGNRVRFVTDAGVAQLFSVDALSQDLSSYIRLALFSDSELTTLLAYNNYTAGLFNPEPAVNILMNYTLDPDDTYYVAAQLMNNSTPVATSEVAECAVWVAE